jgi:hypothetical protein
MTDASRSTNSSATSVTTVEQLSCQLWSGLGRLRNACKAIKIAVWQRDGGKCIVCGGTDNLHFDHIVVIPDAQSYRFASAACRITIALRRDARRGEASRDAPGGKPTQAEVKDATPDGCLLLVNLQPPTVGFSNIAIPQRDLPPMGVPSLRTAQHPPLRAFQNLRTLVLRQRPTHLEKEPSLRALLEWMGDNQQFDACPLKLFR